MKQLRLIASVDAAAATELVRLFVDDPAISETRILDWNTTREAVTTVLYALRGDPTAFRTATEDADHAEIVAESPGAGDWQFLLVTAEATAGFACLVEAVDRRRFLIRKPIVHADGEISCRVIGDPTAIQETVAWADGHADVRVDRIGTFPASEDQPTSALSDRQQAVLAAAVEMGYYEQPRAVTHEDLAAKVDCAPTTVSEHLQKAEAKLVRAVLDDFGPTV